MSIEKGIHKAQAISFDLGTNEKTGSDFALIVFRVVEGEQCEGEEIYHRLYFTDAAAENSMLVMRKMGWIGDDICTVTEEDLPTVVEIIVDEEEFNGKTSMKVKWVRSVGERGPMRDRMDDASRRDFSLRMRDVAKNVPPLRSTQPNNETQAANGAKQAPPANCAYKKPAPKLKSDGQGAHHRDNDQVPF